MRRLFVVVAVLAAAPLLLARATVRRDARGIPYIKAANERDLFFAQGYVTASDRLWQMELLRRTMAGELAEILGKDVVEEDKRRRAFGFRHVIEATADKHSPEFKTAMQAYADGVNAWIKANEGRLGLEFEILGIKPRPWTPEDTLLVGALFAEDLSTTWHADLARAAFSGLPKETQDFLFPTHTAIDLYLVGEQKRRAAGGGRRAGETADAASSSRALPAARRPPDSVVAEANRIEEILRRSRERVGLHAEDLAASNNWVVSGKRSASGKPMLANDPHLAPSSPSIWYMTYLESPTIHAAGVTTPGVPGILLGHNANIAWGCTNLGPDVQDLYRETFDPENPRRYKTPDGWAEAEVRRETIKVKGESDVVIDVITTRHGPIIVNNYALQWPALRESQIFDGFYWVTRASNWEEFRAALRRYSGPAQNFVYADRKGNIGYYGAGRIPIRDQGDGSVPLDGATSRGPWTRFIPFEELPHLFNPPSGLIVTANQRVEGPSYPHHLTTNALTPYRARRIHELLSPKAKLTMDDFRRTAGDTYSRPDAIFAKEVAKIAGPEIAARFANWDGVARTDSTVIPLVVTMRNAFWRRVLAGMVGADLAKQYRWFNSGAVIDRVITERKPEWLPKEFASYADLLLASWRDARGELTKSLGPDESKWTLGNFRKYRFRHAIPDKRLTNVEIPATSGGSSQPVNASAGVSMRLFADLVNWDLTRQGIALGQSGHADSTHAKDQLDDWLAVWPRVFPFSEAAVKASTTLVSSGALPERSDGANE